VGDFVYDGTTNRTVAVHTAGMTEALQKLYHADAVLKELLGQYEGLLFRAFLDILLDMEAQGSK
jgi:hypothetical protein